MHASKGRFYLPADEAKRAGLRADALRRGEGGQPLRDTARTVVRPAAPKSSDPGATVSPWRRLAPPCASRPKRLLCALAAGAPSQVEAAEAHLRSARGRRAELPAGCSGVFLPAVPAEIFLGVRAAARPRPHFARPLLSCRVCLCPPQRAKQGASARALSRPLSLWGRCSPTGGEESAVRHFRGRPRAGERGGVSDEAAAGDRVGGVQGQVLMTRRRRRRISRHSPRHTACLPAAAPPRPHRLLVRRKCAGSRLLTAALLGDDQPPTTAAASLVPAEPPSSSFVHQKCVPHRHLEYLRPANGGGVAVQAQGDGWGVLKREASSFFPRRTRRPPSTDGAPGGTHAARRNNPRRS